MKSKLVPLTLIFMLTISGLATAGRSLGISHFAIIEYPNQQLVLQVSHIFLGAADREAYFKLEGCTEEPLWFQVPYDEKGVRWNSEIELASCHRLKPITLSLYYEERNGIRRLFKSYSETARLGSIPEKIYLSVMCIDKLLIGGFITSEALGTVLDIYYEHGSKIVHLPPIKVVAGYEFKYTHTLDGVECSEISGVYLDNEFFRKFEIPK